MPSATWQGWEQDVERIGGYPDTPDNRAFLDSWQRSESGGGGDAGGSEASYYNPFNMSTGPPGGEWASGGWQSQGAGATQIAIFPSGDAGAHGTVERIAGGLYPNIEAGLRWGHPLENNPQGVIDNLRTWGSTSFANSLAGGSSPSPGSSGGPSGGGSGGGGSGGSGGGGSSVELCVACLVCCLPGDPFGIVGPDSGACSACKSIFGLEKGAVGAAGDLADLKGILEEAVIRLVIFGIGVALVFMGGRALPGAIGRFRYA